MEQLFWLLFFSAVMVWYLIVTIVVGVKGFSNIKSMLDHPENTQNH